MRIKNSKMIIIVISVFLLITAAGCSLQNSQEDIVRNMGFPSLAAMPSGFTCAEAKSIDTGDWCEITYENNTGDFLSLDCYESGTFDINFLENYAKSVDKASVKGKEATVYEDLYENNTRIRIIVWEDEGNNALCILGGNISINEMLQVAEKITYDTKKAITESENNGISSTPQKRGSIEESYLLQYSNVLSTVTEPLLEQYMKNDKAVSDFTLESFYKSFEFFAADGLLVEVFDYDYFMKADDDVIITGGMYRDESGKVRGFVGSFGQLAAVSRNGQLIKTVPITDIDVKLEPEGTDEETLAWINEKVMTAIKSPTYIVRNMLYR